VASQLVKSISQSCPASVTQEKHPLQSFPFISLQLTGLPVSVLSVESEAVTVLFVVVSRFVVLDVVESVS